ncbi:DUF1275 domain-containing protein [Luteolibacter pohnpeiensis]|uniref:DUF1275 domain-containing protein n=1 Tax=Luteolibacter pohnpeiensis TaxID=454153 RepID=A0A934VXI3_9BACT|nr:YoaK family protein [Luteolibacter pohnpeiensis]MBK1884390.1 DUF1275 domain-containing protein [Luteolibacter pohnpeiensis]
MIRKLPSWVWAGAWLLAFVAGMINVVGLLGFEHQAVTHLTGTTSLLAESIAIGKLPEIFRLLGVIGSFLAGAIASGFIIQDSTLNLGHRYGVALFLESALLALATLLLAQSSTAGICLASAACGLQNAMASTYSGAVVRTTHVSGMFTDIGIFLGHLLRGLKPDYRRLFLYSLIISGFIMGGIAGAIAFHHFSYRTLWIPAAMTASAAILYELNHIIRPGQPLSHSLRGRLKQG